MAAITPSDLFYFFISFFCAGPLGVYGRRSQEQTIWLQNHLGMTAEGARNNKHGQKGTRQLVGSSPMPSDKGVPFLLRDAYIYFARGTDGHHLRQGVMRGGIISADGWIYFYTLKAFRNLSKYESWWNTEKLGYLVWNSLPILKYLSNIFKDVIFFVH